MNRLAPTLAFALVAAIGIAAAGLFIGTGIERFRMDDRSIVIKGLAQQTVDSDYANWGLTVRRAGGSFAEVQKALVADRDQVVVFLRSQGFTPEELEVRPLIVRDAYSREYASANTPTRYNGEATVIVNTSRIDTVQQAALATDPLIAAGVQLDAGNGPEYELRGFNNVKGDLLKAATDSARSQAEQFAAEAGATLGPLKAANQGVIQISGIGGNRFDSSTSREKRLRVVSTFTYYLE